MDVIHETPEATKETKEVQIEEVTTVTPPTKTLDDLKREYTEKVQVLGDKMVSLNLLSKEINARTEELCGITSVFNQMVQEQQSKETA